MSIVLIFYWPTPATSVVLIGKTCLHNMVYLLEKYCDKASNKGKGQSIKDVHTPRGEGGLPKVYEKCTKGEGGFSNCVRTHF